MKLFLFVSIVSLPGICFCQPTMEFKGEVIYNNTAVTNYSFLIDGHSVTTGLSDGYFKTSFPANTIQVKVRLTDNNKYVLLYPADGIIYIPKDSKVIPSIILGTNTPGIYLKELAAITKQINSSDSKTATENKALQAKIDSIKAILNQLNFSRAELESFLANRDNKRDMVEVYYPEITKMLRNYLVKAQNLEIEFDKTAKFAFNNSNALRALDKTITEYNPCIEKINETHAMYFRKITFFWQNDSLANEFENIANTIVEDIHKKNVLPFNDIKDTIMLYSSKQLPGDREENKTKIQNRIKVLLPVFATKLDILEKRINDFIARLSDY